MGILLWRLYQYLTPDNQHPQLHIDDDWLTGSKAEGFQPESFNGQLWSGVDLRAVEAIPPIYDLSNITHSAISVGEVAADIIRKQLYGKEAKDLTEAEKQTISALSQLASGLAVAAGGGNFGDASAAISSSKNAVENNGLSWADGGNFIGIPYETGANLDSNLDAYAQGYLTEEEIIQLMDDMNSGRFMYAPLREDFKRFQKILLFW